ncbi:hypothetical protein [Sinorhizobium sp. 7-81]
MIVDTAVITAAPARFFCAGIGDAITKSFEAHGCLLEPVSTSTG